jgi:periplasmic protein TonB
MKRWWSAVITVALVTSVFTNAQQSGTGGDFSTPSAPKSDTSNPSRVRISEKVAQVLAIKKIPPNYPKDARQAGIQGSVVMKAVIDTNGDVVDLTLIQGHPKLAPAAIDAVKQWKYKPYLLNGWPVNAEMQITVNFTLSK